MDPNIDNDDDDLIKAIALSLESHNGFSSSSSSSSSEPYQSSYREIIDLTGGDDGPPKRQAETMPNSFLGIDRKQMEKERLARKRKAPISPPAMLHSKKKQVSNAAHESTGYANAKPVVHSGTFLGSRNHGRNPSLNKAGPQFFGGEIRRTAARGHERSRDISIEEVLQRDDLSLAVLSSFQWDIDWLITKLDTPNLRMTLIMQAKEESTRQQYLRETSTMANLRLCFPPMEGQVNCMHAKLLLLAHPAHLRIVVSTANLVPYDWGETGVMENMVFLIDLPRLDEPKATSRGELTCFAQELIHFVEAMGLERTIIDSLSHFDFSSTTDLAFVHTIGGRHMGPEELWRRTGFCGLSKAVRDLNLATDESLLVDYVTSSLGHLDMSFLATLCDAVHGKDGSAAENLQNIKLSQGKSKAAQTQKIGSMQNTQEQLQENFAIYFPTEDTVCTSTGGVAGGGTICFRPDWYTSPTFPRELLRDCRSRRRGLLMHNKVSEGNDSWIQRWC